MRHILEIFLVPVWSSLINFQYGSEKPPTMKRGMDKIKRSLAKRKDKATSDSDQPNRSLHPTATLGAAAPTAYETGTTNETTCVAAEAGNNSSPRAIALQSGITLPNTTEEDTVISTNTLEPHVEPPSNTQSRDCHFSTTPR